MPLALPPLALPTLVAEAAPVSTLAGLALALQACFQPPARTDGSQATVRFSLDARGALRGRPQVVFSTSVAGEADRRALNAAVLDALRRCTPFDVTAAFGHAVAGRSLTIRLLGGPPPRAI